MFTLQVLEFVVWTLINSVVLIGFSIAGIVSLLIKLIGFEYITSHISSLYPLHLGDQKIGPLSSISVWTPQLYATLNYEELVDKLDFDSEDSSKFCPNKALFFCYLSGLSYENPPVVKKVAQHWGLRFKYTREVSCTCYIFYDMKRRLVVVTFKGTSPFNLTEWLTDAIMYKMRPKWKSNLPGLVHQGIYNALFDPSDSRYRNIKLKLEQVFTDLKKDQPDAPIVLWVTGHSLGAGLATLFSSLWFTPRIDHKSVKDTPDLYDYKACFRGLYTFGNPRCGDNEFADQLEEFRIENKVPYFRVRNANDIICSLPIGAQEKLSTQHFFKQNSWARQLLQRPQGALNYKHFGSPIFIGYDTHTYQEREPTFGEKLSNIAGYLKFVFSNVFSTEATLYSKFSRLMTPNLLHDHYPSEYIRHLQAVVHDHNSTKKIK